MVCRPKFAPNWRERLESNRLRPVIPFEQLSEALTRWRAERRKAVAGGNGAPATTDPGEEREGEVEPEEILEPEPD